MRTASLSEDPLISSWRAFRRPIRVRKYATWWKSEPASSYTCNKPEKASEKNNFNGGAEMLSTVFSIFLYLVFDDLPKSQVEIHLTFAKELEVAAAATRLSLALNSVGQLQLYQACLKAYSPHWWGGGCHLDSLGIRTTLRKPSRLDIFGPRFGPNSGLSM